MIALFKKYDESFVMVNMDKVYDIEFTSKSGRTEEPEFITLIEIAYENRETGGIIHKSIRGAYMSPEEILATYMMMKNKS